MGSWLASLKTVLGQAVFKMMLGTNRDVSLIIVCCPFVEEEFLLFFVNLAVFKLNVRSCELLSLELGGDCSNHSCLVSVLHVVFLKDESVLYGNILRLTDAVSGHLSQSVPRGHSRAGIMLDFT